MIRPLSINADGTLNAMHVDADGGPHTVVIPASGLVFAPNGDHRYVTMTCSAPGCGRSAVTPIGGGDSPADVQAFFVHFIQKNGCTCGQVKANVPMAIAQSHVKMLSESMDGVGRWAAGTVK